MRFSFIRSLLCCLTPCLAMASQAPLPWKDRHAEGWAWYHNYAPPEEKKKPEEPTDPKVVIALVREELERSLAKALLEPTTENIMAYMAMQKKWVDQSKTFSETWQRIVLTHPELASLSPTTQYGVQVKKEVDAEERRNLIRSLAKSKLLLFFYEGGDPYSQAFALVVNQFSIENNWPVKTVSMDGLILRDFPQSIADPTIAKEMGVNFFPALFTVDIQSRQATPIAFGMVTTSQIEENIVVQFLEGSRG